MAVEIAEKVEVLLDQDLTVKELRALKNFVKGHTELSNGRKATFQRRIAREIWRRTRVKAEQPFNLPSSWKTS